MEKFSKPEFELCLQYMNYSEIIETDYSGIKEKLFSILSRCSNYRGNDFVEIVFRHYILCNSASEVYVKIQKPNTIMKVDDITKIIVYKQSEDIDINILAKIKCKSFPINKRYFPFLDLQIDKLFIENNMDLVECYKALMMSEGITDFILPNMLTKSFE